MCMILFFLLKVEVILSKHLSKSFLFVIFVVSTKDLIQTYENSRTLLTVIRLTILIFTDEKNISIIS